MQYKRILALLQTLIVPWCYWKYFNFPTRRWI